VQHRVEIEMQRRKSGQFIGMSILKELLTKINKRSNIEIGST
jgi:hypothetical protein